eukprot:691386-Amphidinium_carterae.1
MPSFDKGVVERELLPQKDGGNTALDWYTAGPSAAIDQKEKTHQVNCLGSIVKKYMPVTVTGLMLHRRELEVRYSYMLAAAHRLRNFR